MLPHVHAVQGGQGHPVQSTIFSESRPSRKKKISSFRSFSLDPCLISPATQLTQRINYRAANVSVVGGWPRHAEKNGNKVGGWGAFHLHSVEATHQIAES